MHFVSAGCSYSQVPNTDTAWPVHVQEAFKLSDDEVTHLGSGAIGNEMISRLVIYHVNNLLKSHKPEDLLVGIMWSGCDREVVIQGQSKRIFEKATPIPELENISYEQFIVDKTRRAKDYREVYNNPLSLATNESIYYTLNSHWTDELTVTYYENFVDELSSIIKTCEHILRTEWFLKNHNIKYFMTEYDIDVFLFGGVPNMNRHIYSANCPALGINSRGKNISNHPDVKYLYDMIDKSYWLPVNSLGEWANQVSIYDYARERDPHPSTEQHKDFTQQVILPFLLKKYNISQYNI